MTRPNHKIDCSCRPCRRYWARQIYKETEGTICLFPGPDEDENK